MISLELEVMSFDDPDEAESLVELLSGSCDESVAQ